jgi:hypothetical protein
MDLHTINNGKNSRLRRVSLRLKFYHNQGGKVMNKKLVLAAALVFGVTGLMLANTVKAQDAGNTDNSAMNADNSAVNADNSAK